MNTPPEEKWEMHVQHTARAFPYPATPDIAGVTRAALRPPPRKARMWLRAAAVIALALLAGMLFVPEIRAGVLEFLRVGAVRIFFTSSTPAPTGIPGTQSSETTEANSVTLEDAERVLGVPIRLPSYPADLGMPDTVSIEDDRVAVVTLVWHMPNTDDARLVLQMIGAGVEVAKYGLPDAVQVSVNGEIAVWLETPHFIEMTDSDGRIISDTSWLIQSHVLVWVDQSITYRLETAQRLSEALQIAESLGMVSGR